MRETESRTWLAPDKVFAARWATALLGEAMNRLRQEYATRHKMATVEVLKAFLDVANSKDPPSYEQAAAALQVSVGAVKTQIHRLRKQYTALVIAPTARSTSSGFTCVFRRRPCSRKRCHFTTWFTRAASVGFGSSSVSLNPH